MDSVPCPTCDELFGNEHGMKVHHGRVHGPIDDPTEGEYPCPTCDRAFDHELGVKTHHYRSHDESIAEQPEKTCPECGDTFATKRSNHDRRKYCSYECVASARFDRVDLTCSTCGTDFEAFPSELVGRRNRQFCSHHCSTLVNRGQDHPNWRGGYNLYHAVRNQLRGPYWKVLRSQNIGDECETCGSDEPGLHLHHIIPLLCGGTNDPFNLMTLCNSCHQTAEWFTADYVSPVLTDA